MALEMKYFVLKPSAKYPMDLYARASQAAMMAYAAEIEDTDEELCRELRDWVERESKRQDNM